jgi:hypothetical protein
MSANTPHTSGGHDGHGATPAVEQRYPVIGPGLTVGHREDQLHGADPRDDRGWWVLLSIAGMAMRDDAGGRHRLAPAARRRHLGHQRPRGWGFDIINFVWWIGIGHAGTLISAILLLLQAGVAHLDQPLRRGHDAVRGHVRRDVPALPHRPSLAGLLAASRYPTPWAMWPQFRSPLIWDVFAVSTYATVSAAVLVRGPDSRPRHAARPRQTRSAR